ncbi:hypothetical protein BG006_008374 [Podila minutissima]|uniref:Uncharacterized protein n=1 Tax=Podila minutissima TaxID=64525 RepID=A0A9P5SG80_9FUNG|nr:hypothetical protein BG006_008374 [Podila minutissima]
MYISNTFWQVIELEGLEVACCEWLLHMEGLKIRHIEDDQLHQNFGCHLRFNLQSVEFRVVSQQSGKTSFLLHGE